MIIVTGCSHSSGYEINDHLLGLDTFSEKDRRRAIWKWYRKNYKKKISSIEELDQESLRNWHLINERNYSWPALLSKKLRFEVINLSVVGSSIGRSMIEFSNYCKNNSSKDRRIAIHQLPQVGRFYMRFDSSRINVLPNSELEDIGYNKLYFADKVKKLKEKYKKIIYKDTKNNYILKHYHRCLKRIIRLGIKNNIENFFILPSPQISAGEDIKVIIDNFYNFMARYKKGPAGHVIDINFNNDIVDLIMKKLKENKLL
jgi:hypothetical protein